MRHEDIPEINNPKIRFPVLEGDKLMKEVLNGGYNVQPKIYRLVIRKSRDNKIPHNRHLFTANEGVV